MQTLAWLLSLSLALTLLSPNSRGASMPLRQNNVRQNKPQARQLLAVRGEIVRKEREKEALLLTVKPARDFAEVTVLARENDLVGMAEGGPRGEDLLGLLSGDPDDDEALTAAELDEGDVVSIIYDPLLKNRALEIYIH